MTRALSPAAFAVAAALAVTSVAIPPAPAQAQQQDIMQCMERCLRHEGRDQKEMCKLRCADLPSVTGPGGRPAGDRDCMARFKACGKDCGRDRQCAAACKAELMSCK
jgi:hypothetical protein